MENLPLNWYIELTSQEEFDTWKKWWFTKQPHKEETHKSSEAYTLPYYCGLNGKENYYWYNNSPHKDHDKISFEDFKRLVLKEESIPEYVECIKALEDGWNGYQKGKVYKIENKYITGGVIAPGSMIGSVNYNLHFILSTKEAFDLQNKPKEPEFKVGDWILTSNDAGGWGNSKELVANKILKIKRIEDDTPYETKVYFEGDLRTALKEVVRYATQEEIAKVTTIKKNPLLPEDCMNTYGLKVGDIIPEKILHEWCKLPNNTWESYKWVSGNHFTTKTNRKIIKFELKDGVLAAHMSDCSSNFHIKAEGFKEFMDNFNKPKVVEEWYIRYTPEITEDIFNTLSKKLDELYGNSTGYFGKATYELFVKQKHIRNSSGKSIDIESCQTWGIDNNPQGRKEKSVWDFISKTVEPMKEELTCLPEKWCIQGCEEFKNWCALEKTRNIFGEKSKFYFYLENGASQINGWKYVESLYSPPTNRVPITFEQFKKWILKSEDKPKFEVGKWYQYNTANNWALKCSKVTLSAFSYKDCINLTNKSYCINSEKYESSYNIDNTHLGKEIPLSEIQQYLPEDHIDKIKTEKVIDMIEIQAECKRRFPIGSTVMNTNGRSVTLVEDFELYRINQQYIWASKGQGSLYCNGKYATLISLPEKKYDYEVVHCTTQEEWDFVSKIIGKANWINPSFDYCGDDCINLQSKTSRGSRSHYTSEYAKIYSFSEWCSKFGYKPEFMQSKSLVGRWVKALEDKPFGGSVKQGEFGLITGDQSNLDNWYADFPSQNHYSFRFDRKNIELMPEGFIPPSKELSKEELLIEAKRRYPIGTKVSPLNHLDVSQIIISKHSHHIYEDCWDKDEQKIWFFGQYSRPNDRGVTIYDNGKWAEIVSKPEENTSTYSAFIDPWEVKSSSKLETKKKGFDENEHLSKSYNQKLEIKIKKQVKKPIKLQLL